MVHGLLNVSKTISKGEGLLSEVKSADQVSDRFKADISFYKAPKMICGYCSCANALYIAEHFPDIEMTKSDVNKMINQLRNFKIMQPR